MLETGIYDIIAVFITGSVIAMASFSLGAYFVFRTKREPYESFWPKQPKSDAVNLDEIGEPTPFVGMETGGVEPPLSPQVAGILNKLNKQQSRFMDDVYAQSEAIRRAHEEEGVNDGV